MDRNQDSRQAADEENEEYPPWFTMANFIVWHSTERNVGKELLIVSQHSYGAYKYRNLVSCMRADHPKVPLVTLVQRLCGLYVRLDESIRGDRLCCRMRGVWRGHTPCYGFATRC